MNWAIDLIVLVGILGMESMDYIMQIGLHYLMTPAMVIATGMVADHVRGRENS